MFPGEHGGDQGTPVTTDVGEMLDAHASINDSEEQLVNLGPTVSGMKSAGFDDRAARRHGHARGVIVDQRQLGAERPLEIRIGPPAGPVQQIVIGINPCIRFDQCHPRDTCECTRGEQALRIEKNDSLAGARRQPCAVSAHEVVQLDEANARVLTSSIEDAFVLGPPSQWDDRQIPIVE
jgi:hypothetical protein